ncbi:ArnT family glycosyltransferase [Saccharopolyspora dendranthemae]|uniref:4-amino-4-deoxy-L-arabinose transferase-like glycosyltransferase n=1 Tax=Saccharopolyspora dendranthemae TaxID=1181886 RepID=A0A561VBK9_9PSEU|nr:glycosyltransferase family 39 protein [Saccharopolyspora dendranthemae]TWG08982.1 4-amino-4-deoxy-L-arabinose transferase-like glycosyltransferase [Saccharopolyspora dendranthemae]
MIAVEEAAPQRTRVEPRRLALAGICALAAVLHLWGIGSSWGNGYYSAAVKSMSTSFETFFFGSFDAAGVVTVDKPPMALWLQVISVKIFGFHQFAVLFPQAICGVVAVFLLHGTVRRWAGENAALIASLVLALSPTSVLINRDNNPDTLLVLLVVAAAWAMTRAMSSQRRSTGWIALAAFLVGCGFMTKMLQAWMVLPAFVAAYLVGSRNGAGRKIADLGVAAGVLLVSSFWWVVATALWPSPKPYIGGSTDGSAWDLIFGYNGFGRILGEGAGQGGGPGGGPGGGGPGGGGGFSGTAGVLRMFNEQLAGQISWLLPLCGLVLVAMLVFGARRWRAGGSPDREQIAGWVLWGGWLVVIAVMFSFAQGTMHPYYTTMLAPAVGAVVGAGLVRFWQWYRRPGGKAWLLLPAGVALSVTWAMTVVARDMSWHPWTGYLAVGVGVLALVVLVVGRRGRPGLAKAGFALALTAVLAVPATWSVIGVVGGETGMMGGVNPMAGPETSMGGPGGGRQGRMPSADRQAPPGMDGQMPPGASGDRGSGGGMGGPGGASLSADQQKIVDHVQANAGGVEVPLAVEGGANGASSYIINTDLTVVGMGGFMGSDDAPSVARLAEWKQRGQLGFVLLGGGPGGMMRSADAQNPQTPDQDDQNQSAQPQDGQQQDDGRGGAQMPGGGQAATDRENWVKQNCTLVDPATYGGSTDSSQQLYTCG